MQSDAMRIILMILVMLVITFMLWCEQKKLVYNKVTNRMTVRRNDPVGRGICYAILLLILIFLFALRPITETTGGVDAIVYKTRFMNATGDIVTALKSQDNEIGFGFFVYIVRCFTDKYEVFQILYYFVLFLLLININKNIIKTTASFFLTWIFLTLNLFLSVCLVRNVLACFLAFNSVALLERNKKISSAIYAVLAISCHYSAIIILYGFFIYWLSRFMKFSDKAIVFILALNCALVLVFGRFVFGLFRGGKYSIYLDGGLSIAWGQIFKFGLLAIVFYVVFKAQSRNHRDRSLQVNKTQVQAMSLVIPAQLFFPIVYRMFSVSAYSQLQVWNEIAINGKSFRKAINVCCFIALLLELYLFITESIPAYGIL